MRVGYRPGTGLFHRAHPFTVAAFAAAVSLSVFALPGPAGPLVLLAALALLTLVGRLGTVWLPALLVAAPFWFFLLLIHGVFGGDVLRAVTLGARITTMLLAFLVLLASVHPERLVEAIIERGWPFAVAYLLSATLQAVPRLRDRARAILDAQRARGMAVRGSPMRRARAMIPLAVPLIMGALAESAERAFALEVRGGSPARRTPLDPPPDSVPERMLRWLMVLGALAAALWAVAR